MAEQHLGAAISFYKEGVNLTAEEDEFIDGPRPAKRIKLDLSDVNDSFKNAHEQATIAFHNTGLSLEKRILAVYIRVMAKLLEKRNDPARALISCRQYLEEMHAMEEVKSNFCLKLHGSPAKKLLNKLTRAEKRLNNIILSVYHVNRILFGITQMIGVSNHFFVWPSVKCECRKEVDPLRNPKCRETVRKQGVDMDVIRTFGQQDEEAENRLKRPRGIATNSEDEYLVVDRNDTKVFDSSGKYLYSLSGLLGDHKFQYHTFDIDTDQNGKVYLLVRMVKSRANWYEVFVLDEDLRLYKFPLRNKSKGRKISVNQHRDKTEVLVVLEGERGLHVVVEVYEADGTFVCQFGERILHDAQDIVGANNGHVYVLDKCHESKKKFIREFGARRDELRTFDVAYESVAIAFHQPSQHIVVISASSSKELELSVYKCNIKYTKLVRSQKFLFIDGGELVAQNVTVTITGRIAVVIGRNFAGEQQGEVIVY